MTTHEKQNVQQQQLFSKLWDISNTLRGTMEPSEYKEYILGLIFYRYLSDNVQSIIAKDLTMEGIDYYTALTNEKYRSDFLEVLYDNDSAGYYIEPEYLWQAIIKKINSGKFDIFILRKAFNKLIESTVGHASAKEFENLFDSVDLDSSKLGKTETEKSNIIAKVMLKINEINFEIDDAEIDILGDAYEYLISKFASESVKAAGEFYTPQPVSKLLAKLVSQGKTEIKTVYDPTCGSGSLLLRVYKELKIGHLYGQELKTNSYNIARMNMMLHGLKYNKFDIYHGDTLEDDGFKGQEFEVIVANPPYSSHWSANQKFLSDERFSAYGKLAPKTKADFAFIQNMIYKLAANGVMAVVIPHGVLFRGNAELIIRKYMIEKNWIDTIISLPANMFYGTSIPTCIIVMKKWKSDNAILFIDASKEFQKQGNKNTLTDENIIKIINVFNKRKTIAKFSNLVAIEIIKANDYNLNIARYIDNTAEKEIINIKNMQDKLINNEQAMQKLNGEFKLMFKDLVINNEKGYPKIRFKGFNDEWENKKIGEILNYQQPTKFIIKDKIENQGKIPVLTANKSFVLGYVNEKNIYENIPVIIFDDFTMDMKYVNFKFMIKSSAIKILKSKNNNINLFYVFNLLKNLKLFSSDHKRYYISYVSEINVLFPNIYEQTKVAQFFTIIDRKIELVKEQLSLLAKQKQYYLNNMFANEKSYPQIRFKKFINENNFQKVKLKEICLIQKGKSISKDKYDINGKYCIFNGGINKSGSTNLFNKENCISISEGGNSCGYVNYIKDKFWSADHNYTLSKVNLNLFYLFYLLKNNEINIKKLRVGTGLPNIQKKDLENIIIYIIRNLQEQNKIGNFFTIIDKKIELVKEQLSLLTKQKQYYLNNMFI